MDGGGASLRGIRLNNNNKKNQTNIITTKNFFFFMLQGFILIILFPNIRDVSKRENWYLASFCCCSWDGSNPQVNKNPMTCLPSHTFIYSNYDVSPKYRWSHTYVTLNNSLGNTIIPSQRLVTMSASLRTQTVLHSYSSSPKHNESVS